MTVEPYDVFKDISARIDEQLKMLQGVIDTDVAAFDELIREQRMPAIIPRSTR